MLGNRIRIGRIVIEVEPVVDGAADLWVITQAELQRERVNKWQRYETGYYIFDYRLPGTQYLQGKCLLMVEIASLCTTADLHTTQTSSVILFKIVTYLVNLIEINKNIYATD